MCSLPPGAAARSANAQAAVPRDGEVLWEAAGESETAAPPESGAPAAALEAPAAGRGAAESSGVCRCQRLPRPFPFLSKKALALSFRLLTCGPPPPPCEPPKFGGGGTRGPPRPPPLVRPNRRLRKGLSWGPSAPQEASRPWMAISRWRRESFWCSNARAASWERRVIESAACSCW